MARFRSQLALSLGTALLLALPLFGQAPASTPAAGPVASQKKAARRAGTPAASPSPELENVRKALEALTPEQRKDFRENLNRWMNLAPDEKQALREREELRRKHRAEEIADALKQLGIDLDPPRRQAFMRRYTEERRKVEEQIRQETEARRATMVADILARLKVEFSSSAP